MTFRQMIGGEETPYKWRLTLRPSPCVRSIRPSCPKVEMGLQIAVAGAEQNASILSSRPVSDAAMHEAVI